MTKTIKNRKKNPKIMRSGLKPPSTGATAKGKRRLYGDRIDLDNAGDFGHSEGGEHVEGFTVDLDLLGPDGRDLGHEVHAALALLLLQFEGDAAHGTLLNALHEMGGEAGDFVPEPL